MNLSVMRAKKNLAVVMNYSDKCLEKPQPFSEITSGMFVSDNGRFCKLGLWRRVSG